MKCPVQLSQNRIDSSRLTAIGYGEENLIADNETPAGRRLNRRVELVIDVDEIETYSQQPIEGVSFDSLDMGLDQYDDVESESFETVDELMADESAESVGFIDETSDAPEQAGIVTTEEATEEMSFEAMDDELIFEQVAETVKAEEGIEEISFEALDDEPSSSKIPQKAMDEIIAEPIQAEEMTFESVDDGQQ